MQFFVGTSAYSVKEWKGSFYPDKLPQKQMLNFYSERFSTVEINNSFYRMPTVDVVKGWAEQTPQTFRFALKAPQSITHFKRLKGIETEIDTLLTTVSELKERQGPILFQLPANFKKDLDRLNAFLSVIAKRTPVAFEFRNETWLDAEVFDCLRAHSCALCIADAEELPCVDLVSTTDWGYVRLRREDYTDQVLRGWIKRIRAQKWDKAYVYFKHEETGTGPKFAARFLELAAKGTTQ